ncbi:hypothetical protein DFH11DRAFT_1631729 [Phellopilus nigrolimitatus]|nr:hypothetical protein DFH11DRAFT_1631729 [Phellopilus nigrolimitatus]
MSDDPVSPTSEDFALEPSLVDQVLRLPEIQGRIFSFNEQGDAARCARVCQGWRDVALDHTWHTVYGVKPLFELLAPMKLCLKNNKVTELDFMRKIRSSDWIRFSLFARRVRCLTLTFRRDKPNGILASAYTEVLRSRPMINILPNLLELYISVWSETSLLQYAVLFLHASLKHLSFKISPHVSNVSDIELFLDEVSSRASNVNDISATFTSSFPLIETSFSSFIAGRKALSVLYMASCTLTTAVLEAASCLPHLKQLSIDLQKTGNNNAFDAVQSILCADGNSRKQFPSMRFLDLQSRLDSITDFISSRPNFSCLWSLRIDMVCHGDADDLQRCLEVISTSCKNLVRLVFTQFNHVGVHPAVLDQEKASISAEILMPITSLPFLVVFELSHTQYITISDDELVDLLSRCLRLTTLRLNPEPIQLADHNSPVPSLAVIHRIVECRPKLETLAIYLDASNVELPIFVAEPLKSLGSLSLGRSPIKDADRVALYLSQVLPQSCELVTGVHSASAWSEVKKKLPLLMSFHLEERSRFCVIEEENRTLRNKLLSVSKLLDQMSLSEAPTQETRTEESERGANTEDYTMAADEEVHANQEVDP